MPIWLALSTKVLSQASINHYTKIMSDMPLHIAIKKAIISPSSKILAPLKKITHPRNHSQSQNQENMAYSQAGKYLLKRRKRNYPALKPFQSL